MSQRKCVVSKTSHNTLLKFAAASQTNGNAPMEIASLKLTVATEKLNARTHLMKEKRTAALKATVSTTKRDAVATQPPNGPAPMGNVSLNLNTVMVNSSVEMALTSNSSNAATKASAIMVS
jgi:hypothetical protein